jgi:hypothetical protein
MLGPVFLVRGLLPGAGEDDVEGAASLAGADGPYPRKEPTRPVAVLAAEEARL